MGPGCPYFPSAGPIVTYTLPYPLTGIRVAEYPDPSGRSTFRRWFDELDAVAPAKVSTAPLISHPG